VESQKTDTGASVLVDWTGYPAKDLLIWLDETAKEHLTKRISNRNLTKQKDTGHNY